MSSRSPGGLSPSSSARRSTGATVALIVLMMVVLFAAGFGISWLVRGNGSSTADGDGGGGGGNTPANCTTITTTPGAGLPSPDKITVNVYNATDRSGLAASTGDALTERGFTVGEVDNDPLNKSVAGIAEIRVGAKGNKVSQLLLYYVPGATVVKDQRTDATADLVLGEKFDGVKAQSVVASQLAQPSTSASGPGCTTPPPASASSPSASGSA